MDRFFGCDLELTSGQLVKICADETCPEHRFEVFPIKAELSSDRMAEERQQFELQAPVEILLLQTQDWLDPGIRCEGAIGENPVMKCQGIPGSAPDTATTTCNYFGGIELRGSNGKKLVVATLAFPHEIYVSAFLCDKSIDLEAYTKLALDQI